MPAEVIEFFACKRGKAAVGEFEQKLKALRGKLVLVFFYAMWCGPCRRMLQEAKYLPYVIEEVDSRVVICKVDVDKDKLKNAGNIAIAGEYSVLAIPTTVFIKDMRHVHDITGAAEGGVILHNIKKYL